MKWKYILDLTSRIVLFGLVVFVVILIINFFRSDEETVVPVGAVSMDFPLKNGSFFIAYSGPGQDFLSGGVHQTPNEKYALDITKEVSIKDLFATFVTHKNKSNSTFGTPIYSPCFGNIKKVENSLSDLPIGTRDRINSSGNHVLIGCDQSDVMLAHMKQGSITVREGQVVRSGDPLGEIGNSGNTAGPHLHLMATRTDENDKIVPLPIIFNGRYLKKSDSFNN